MLSKALLNLASVALQRFYLLRHLPELTALALLMRAKVTSCSASETDLKLRNLSPERLQTATELLNEFLYGL